MVKPSLKTTSFKHHPVYVQKSLHVDNPFYGPKPMYQRAEVIPGGDCEAIATDWDTDAPADTITWLPTEGTARVDSHSLLMTKGGAVADNSIYLRLSGPIDLSWAKFVGFWYQGKASHTYVADDIYFYIFTKYGNYAYANAARYVDPFGGYTEQNPAVWHYAEVDLADFIISSGYEGDKLDEVWGVGFCSHNLETTETMIIDQIEFYTIGTGKGPARGLIMSAPLFDKVHAERGYGLAWNEYSGRLDNSAQADLAFAGICTGNPTKTKLTKDVTLNVTTTLNVVDASLLREGYASINDDDTAIENNLVITAVNKIERKVTLETAPVRSFAVADNAYICMEGDEEGHTRVDFIVSGVVNVTAAETTINQGYGVKCEAVGSALTVKEDDSTEEGMTIGKALGDVGAGKAASNVEDFPIKLMTDARTA